MDNNNFVKDFFDGKLDYASFMKCFEHLDLQEKSDFDTKIREIVDKYNTINETKKCASNGHVFGDWKKRRVSHWNGLEDGMSIEDHYCIEYYRICKKCGFEEKSITKPEEYENQQIQKEIKKHKEEIKKLEKRLGIK